MSAANIEKMLMLQLSYIKPLLISAAVKFDIVEHLLEKKRTAEELAVITKTNPSYLFRLLRGLASIGVLNSEPNNTYSVTPFGETLSSMSESNLKSMAKLMLSDHYLAAHYIPQSIESGRDCFHFLHGLPLYDFQRKNPEKSKLFVDALRDLCKVHAKLISSVYNFEHFNNVADIGGAVGTLLTEILRNNKNLNGVLFDQKHIIQEAEKPLKDEFGNRIAVVAGDFFHSIPDNCDCYILKTVIWNWNDEDAMKILRNIRSKMNANAKLLIIEPSMASKESITYDFLMMVASMGKTRTREEYKHLCENVGLKLHRVIQVPNSSEFINEISLR